MTIFNLRMKTLPALVLLAVVITTSSCSLMNAGTPENTLSGTWKGIVTIPDGQVVDVYLEFTRIEDGGYHAILRVPQQTDADIPVQNITPNNKTLIFDIDDIQASFKGTVEDTNTINGEFSQDGDVMPVEFKRTE